jgi:hypothetical protein
MQSKASIDRTVAIIRVMLVVGSIAALVAAAMA